MFHLIDDTEPKAKRPSKALAPRSGATNEKRREEQFIQGWRVLHSHWPAHGRTPYMIRARFIELEDKRESHEW